MSLFGMLKRMGSLTLDRESPSVAVLIIYLSVTTEEVVMKAVDYWNFDLILF